MGKVLLAACCIFSFGSRQEAQNPPPKEPTPQEAAGKEADRLGELLELEDWQVFYVDSTLQHDFAGLKQEIEELRKARVDNMDLYQRIQDKWAERIDDTYRRLFTDGQWKKYLKTGAGRQIKAREKRKAKRIPGGPDGVADRKER